MSFGHTESPLYQLQHYECKNICCSSIRKDVREQQWAIVEQASYFLDWCTACTLMTAGGKGCFCTRRQVHRSLITWPSFATTEGTWMACSGISEDQCRAVELGVFLWTNSKSIRGNSEDALALWQHVVASIKSGNKQMTQFQRELSDYIASSSKGLGH